MKITFRLVNEQEVEIVNNEQVIGRIFSPAGTTRDVPNAIQVCGFDDLFSYWGCGVFSDDSGNPKKDIQILFSEDSNQHTVSKHEMFTDCGRCFRDVNLCRCDDLRLKDIKEIMVDKLK